MIKKMRVGLALQPVATALFANSPFFDGKLNNHKSWRSRVWRDLDQDRTGMLPFVFEQDFGFDAWTEYVLDVPMYFVYRDGKYIDALGQSFRDFLKGKLPALLGEKPKISDKKFADDETSNIKAENTSKKILVLPESENIIPNKTKTWEKEIDILPSNFEHTIALDLRFSTLPIIVPKQFLKHVCKTNCFCF